MATTTVTQTVTEVAPNSPTAPTHGIVRYIGKGLTPTSSPHLYHLPPLDEFSDVRSVPIQDIKSSLELGGDTPYRLDAHGFTARRHPSALHSAPYSRESWNNEELLQKVYIPEVEALVKHLTGAKVTTVDQLVMRTMLHSPVDALAQNADDKNNSDDETPVADSYPRFYGTKPTLGASPAPKVHLDYSPLGARIHLRRYHPYLSTLASSVVTAEDALLSSGIPASDLKKHYHSDPKNPRWSLFSIWRPLKRVRRDPLALSDCRTFPARDYIPVRVRFPSGSSTTKISTLASSQIAEEDGSSFHEEESYLAYGGEEGGHKWHWIWDMEPEEVLVIQLFDSLAESQGKGEAGGVMHSSVDVESTEDEEARESLEVRVAAFW